MTALEPALDCIARGPTWVMRAATDASGAAVTIKAHDASISGALSAARCHRELEILRSPDGASTPRALDLVERDGRPALVLQDLLGYRTVATVTGDSGPWTLDRFFAVAAKIGDALGEVHQRDVIHKALRPEHVLLSPDDRVLLIGLEQATRMAEEEQRYDLGAADPSVLAYVSPEQTGRMNRSIDYRTDLYSLGLVLYEMLTGALPFPARDVVGTIHAHIAMAPPAIRSLRANVPRALEAIVARLLSKSPDARYQNAFALADDLRLAATAWRAGEELPPEALGTSDRSGRFVLSQRLYGRDMASVELHARFERVANGERHVVFLTGYSGVGKTALVHETHRPLAERHGLFASGKFDQFGRITPFSAIRRAFGGLIESIVEDHPRLREQLSEDLHEELGSSVAVLLDVLPELSLVVKSKPGALELSTADVDDRFRASVIE